MVRNLYLLKRKNKKIYFILDILYNYFIFIGIESGPGVFAVSLFDKSAPFLSVSSFSFIFLGFFLHYGN